MIVWDPVQQAVTPFGSLKTAALAEKENKSSDTGIRPLCTHSVSSTLISDIVFDIVYLNGLSLTRYPLRERREELPTLLRPVERRFEIHSFTQGNTVQDIETQLRKIIAEGLASHHICLTVQV